MSNSKTIAFGRRVRALRERKGYTQDELGFLLAQELRRPEPYRRARISSIENGKFVKLSKDIARGLAVVLETTTEYLEGETESSSLPSWVHDFVPPLARMTTNERAMAMRLILSLAPDAEDSVQAIMEEIDAAPPKKRKILVNHVLSRPYGLEGTETPKKRRAVRG